MVLSVLNGVWVGHQLKTEEKNFSGKECGSWVKELSGGNFDMWMDKKAVDPWVKKKSKGRTLLGLPRAWMVLSVYMLFMSCDRVFH